MITEQPQNDAEPTSRISQVMRIHYLLNRIERRIDGPRGWARDLDDYFNELEVLSVTNWPRPPQQSVELALRTMRVAFAAQSRIEHPLRTLLAVCDAMGIRLARSLDALGADAAPLLDDLLAAWREANVLPPSMFGEILVEHLHPTVLHQLGERLANTHMRGSSGGARILALRETASVATATSRARELALLLARTQLKRNRPEDARRVLEAEQGNDPRVLALLAETYAATGKLREAIERLRRAAITGGNNPNAIGTSADAIRERMLELAAEAGDLDQAIDQVVALSDGGSLLHWQVLLDLLQTYHPHLVAGMRERLKERSPSHFVLLLMDEGDVEGVIEHSSAKTFPSLQLWRMADWLATDHADVAAKLYERAITLEGATLQSRTQATEFADRLQRIQPFFEALGKSTKPRRIAREVLTRDPNNAHLKKELERVFGNKF